MRVLPVFPAFPPSFWSYRYAVDLVGKKATMPPTGLATVCAMLPRKHFDVMPIVDLNVEPLTDETIKKSDIIFTSSMIVQKNSLEELIERAHYFGKKVVAGGPYPTSYQDDVPADYLILDEAEVTLEPFLQDLLNARTQKVYNEANTLPRIQQELLSKSGKPKLNQTPIPRWDLLKLEQYSSLAIQYSRGCPFNCEFCDITTLFGRESRTKTPEQIIQEIEAIYTTGWRGSIFIVDDNFIGNRAEVRKMLPVLSAWQKKHKYPYTLFTEASMDLANPANKNIREGMIDAGFDSVFIGIESDDAEVLKKMKKQQNLGAISPADKIRILQEAGFEVTGGFIIGSDGEKPDVFERIFKFIQTSGVVIPMAGLLTALRGTSLYNRLEREGRLRRETTGNNTHQLGFNFKPQLDESFLVQGYIGLLQKLFDSSNYYERCRVLSKRRGEYHHSNLVDAKGLHAFANLLFENTLIHPDMAFYKYLTQTAFSNPSRIPEAVVHAAKLRHFKIMTENTLEVMKYTEKTKSLYESFCEHANKIRGDAKERIRELGRVEKSVIKEAKIRYARLHDDFRENARGALDSLTSMVKSYKQNYLFHNVKDAE